jgi:hypothetical protein
MVLFPSTLIRMTGNYASPGLWLTAAAAVSLLTILAARRMALRPTLQAAPS